VFGLSEKEAAQAMSDVRSAAGLCEAYAVRTGMPKAEIKTMLHALRLNR
jgi:hypothetical protein